MQLHYNKTFKTIITDSEANEIMNFKGSHLNFKGEYLKKSLIEIFNEVKEVEEKRITEWTLEELHSILGGFEKEYHKATTGNSVHNEILGNVCEGNVKHALRVGAITKYKFNEGWVYFVHLPQYVNYTLKVEGLKELNRRRDYAKKENGQNN